ncbi:hypothetical protein IMCC3135_06240 [Granulosicoccus antarcticus IMCC3135]|uniref:Adenine nucleotide alpha hydrolase n=2 Tax=Granulosicoccus TaxID=437504 RepID=A0A2Z2NLE5_9GAMM|nr:hypothetical protein IMCC3135_06240 [Granulosicoccus antarcticus IMCC3135]
MLAAMARLEAQLIDYPRLAVALSGGVDSMTLAAVAYRVLGDKLMLVHAVSPAVPLEASDRVREHSQRLGWPLTIVDAGEFSDERYRNNPVNRCYYCKTNLYTRLRQVWDGPVASGANLDDLGDYRPGLLAASEKAVVHPLVEAAIDKQMVRAIARHLQLDDVAELPAQPCLSSRVETGLVINATDLLFVHRIERYLTEMLGPGDVRCRITAAGVRIEVPEDIRELHSDQWSAVCVELEQRIANDGRSFAGYDSYRRGSAFVHKPGDL